MKLPPHTGAAPKPGARNVAPSADARVGFFCNLVEAAGLRVAAPAVEAVVGPPPGAAEAAVAEADLTARLGEVCGGLGLTLTRVRARLDEAVALAEPRRPVLLVVRRHDGRDLVAIHGTDGPTVRLEILASGGRRTLVVPSAQVAATLGLADARLAAVLRVGVMGGGGGETSPSYGGHPLRRLGHLLRPDRPEIAIVVVFALALGVLTLATPVAVQALVNFVAFGGLMQPLVVVGLLLLSFLALAGAIRAFKSYVVEILQRRVFVRVVSDLSWRLPRVRLDAYDRAHGPELVNRFFDVLTIQKAGSALMIDGLDIALQTAVGLLVLGFYHPFLLVFDVALIAAIAFILLGLGRGAVATARGESSAKYAVAGALEELATAPVTYKLAGAPELARARLAELAGRYITARRGHYRVVLRQLVGAVTLHAVAATALLTLGGWLVIQGQLTLGQLVAAELIVSVALASFVKFGKQLEAFYDLLAAVDKLGVLFDLPIEADPGESHVPGAKSAALELRGVAYRYGHGPLVVRDFSLRVAPNEKVAIRGARRAGKSTLAEIACGLREPAAGVVLLDGVDVREIANVSLRTQTELVKGFEIVQGSVVDNVRLGRSDVSAEEVRDALSRFGILDELLALPNGLQTRVTVAGAPLSRSTAQLLMLARASVGAPRAIVVDGILDELDPPSLARALAVLTDPRATWSLVVFTVRDEICAAMDRVVTLDGPRTPTAAAVAPAAAGPG